MAELVVTHLEIPEKCVNCPRCRRVSYMWMNRYYCELSRLSIKVYDVNVSERWTRVSADCVETK